MQGFEKLKVGVSTTSVNAKSCSGTAAGERKGKGGLESGALDQAGIAVFQDITIRADGPANGQSERTCIALGQDLAVLDSAPDDAWKHCGIGTTIG